jgi:hypothetical protein
MHQILTKRIEIPWSQIPWAKVRKGILILGSVVAAVTFLYILTAPPILKACWKAQIRQSQRGAHWPRFYAPLLLGLEDDSPAIHGPFRWYFNTVWGCGIFFFSDNPSGNTE